MLEIYMYKIVELAADMIEANVALMFLGIFISKDGIVAKWRQVFCCALGWSIVSFALDRIALLSIWKTLVIMSGYFLFGMVIFQAKWKRVLFWEIVYIATSIILEFLVIYSGSLLTGIKLNTFLELGQERMVMIIIEKAISVWIMLILYKIFAKRGKFHFYEKFENIVMIICTSIIVIILLFWVYSLTGKYAEIVSLCFLLICAGVIIFLIYSLFIVTEKIENRQWLELERMKNSVLQQSLIETQNAYAHWQKQIHDYKNTIVCLSSMLDSSDDSSVRMYLDKEMEQINKAGHVISCGNNMVDAILNLKWIEAERKHIFFSVQGGVSAELPIGQIELGKILGNLLDNAIEGACHSGIEPYVEVVFNQSECGFTIEVINSASDESINFNKTMKENQKMHGIGLYSIREIVRDNDGVFEIVQHGNTVTARVEF